MNLRRLFTTRGVIVLALVTTLALSYISYRSIIKLNNLASWVDHTHVVQLNLQRTYSALSDADSELKTFIITKDSTYFRNLMTQENVIRHSMSTLAKLTRDNEVQANRLRSLDSLIHARWAYMEATMKSDEAHYDFFAGRIEECNHSLKASIQKLNEEEDKLLEARNQTASDYQSKAPFSLLGFQVVICICLMVGFILVTADLKAKERLQRDTLAKNQELKEQRDFIQSIFEHTVDVIVIIDTNLKMAAMNKRAKQLYDPNNNALGRSIVEVFPQTRDSDALHRIKDALSGKPSHTQVVQSLIHPETYFESFFVPLYAGEKIIGAMAIHHDVSEIVKMTSEIKAMNVELQKSNSELEQFAYVTSHDLQEPLRKIQTFSDMAKRNLRNPEVAEKNLDKLTASSKRMSTLIRDILNYSRISHGPAKTEHVNLNEVVDQVLQDFELTIEEKEAVIETNRLPTVLGSQQQLTQVFSNIISNALKFCTGTPCVRIMCRHAEGKYEISVTDNGVGFDQAYAKQIFGVFQRLHHRNEFAGTGIGLALCKKIIENHGGTINATSSPGKGTTITVTLPDLITEKKVTLDDMESLKNVVKNSLSSGLTFKNENVEKSSFSMNEKEGLQEPFVSE